MRNKYQNYHRVIDRFYQYEGKWLDSYILDKEVEEEDMDCTFSSSLKRLKAGRPELPYETKSTRSQDRDAGYLANENSSGKLL